MKDLFDVEQLTQFEFGAIIITIIIAGLVFGCLIAWGLLNRKNSPKAVSAEKTKEEFEQYKEKVDEHFTQTSEMFKDVTTQYKKLYDHMAIGAVSLGNADTIAMPRLEMQNSDQEPVAEDSSSENIDETVEKQASDNVEQATDKIADQQGQEESKTS